MEQSATIFSKLTATAVEVFRAKLAGQMSQPEWSNIGFGFYDSVIEEANIKSFGLYNFPPIKDLADLILRDSEFDQISRKDGQLDAMIVSPHGGSRLQPEGYFVALYSSAFLQMFLLRLPWDEGTYVRTVIDGFEELRRALRGEKVRVYQIHGLSKVTLSQDKQISTPWGIIKSGPVVNPDARFMRYGESTTTCIFYRSTLCSIYFDRSSNPERKFDNTNIAPSQSGFLLPLACALASKDTMKPAVPIGTWATDLLPFSYGLGYSLTMRGPNFTPEVDMDEMIPEIEEWCRIIERSHPPSLDIAAKRLVSAMAHRSDKGDALIDAIMVWENLLGTSQEVTYRVSASLTKLIEPNTSKRPALRKKLSNIYGVRSRLVHGSSIDISELQQASSDAIECAVQALRAAYKRSHEWLSKSSNERSDDVLLCWD